MNIAGLQKMTLLDYPGKVACTVFLSGCNFRCPFCHNSGILSPVPGDLNRQQLLDFLQKRRGLLDGVCVTGGEPTLQPELAELLAEIKTMGYLVKLDTNGSRPEVLKALAKAGLVDYVAMDIKNSSQRYSRTTGVSKMELSKIEESIRFLLSGTLDYEFRTTVVEEFHDEESILAMGQWLSSLVPDILPSRLFLQPYKDSPQVLLPGLHTPDQDTLEQFVRLLQPYVREVEIRGAD